MMLELDSVTHRYDDQPAVEDISFGVEAGELVAVLGPSGCGKTTLVQAIAGHVRPSEGRVRLRGDDVTTDPPEARDVGLVFQEPTLFPHMTVGENVAYGLGPAGVTDPERQVSEYLDLVALDERRSLRPDELSGGQKRRVELARALAPEPDLLLLDEPLSALDRQLREQLRDEISRIHSETGVTTLFVTHDQEEAMALADRLVVMNEGSVAAVGAPRALYERPPNLFVAEFLGRSNTITVDVTGDRAAVELGGTTRQLADESQASPDRAVCHLRPRDLTLESESTAAAVSLSGHVRSVSDLGRRYEVTVELACGDEVVVEQRTEPPAVGDAVRVEASADALSVFTKNGVRLTHETAEPSLQSTAELRVG
ncbi:ATP-binding cassette domain-containing protein [Halovenus sp. WSH3]|uniref:Molybdate/tungstate import ATP-binding protein WtpC n=1 Tax=Halovenus carboxidivorans TaxID=2692199 RepID=A0A6B0T8U1_9EURY|nr:ABC transporter ATP-binding protein [Halovenus carboxidivorans]MXR52656.1 ATP-binding cassette domain-containing protein [Halovenus carboxidivorans]